MPKRVIGETVSRPVLITPDLVEFGSRLTVELEEEYRRVLLPYGFTDHAGELAAGRLVRSRLAAVAAGEISERLIRRCVALELLHTSTLIHDDILDKGTVRRGVPTLWKSVGIEQALLIGNIVSARALAIVQADCAELASTFLQTFHRVNVAQLRELRQRGTIKDRATHEAINIGKTSAMLELGLVVGCMSSPLWPVDLTHLRNAIREFGVGFQFSDDVEDIQAWRGESEKERSKKADCDIELGNYTLPVTLLVESATTDHRPGDPLTVQTLQAWGQDDWEPSLKTTLRIASEHLQRTEWHLNQELGSNGGAELSHRLAIWIRGMIESWQRKGLDTMLNDLPQQAAMNPSALTMVGPSDAR
ncbi:polyprenyl synthetase family protein [Saccharopolyspora sp. ASAGF58]|uniref:polyprenyl synthetase family protein n=1 Tax=Saccharopolyspora sp. ASAGF58 TaxID=2719023 RepID=UPI001FF0AAAF|nr:polyprenyl synthetase family protein [Saccharopolyspora sp. ASAGF58]